MKIFCARRKIVILKRSGFTLVELLVVIGIIAVLFAVVLIAINPAKRFAEANNARRSMDVRNILDAVITYTADVRSVPASMPSALTCIGNGQSVHNNGGRAVNPPQSTDGVNLIGLWHLDGNANDSGSSSYNGSSGAGVLWSSSGRFASSANLTGNSGSSVSILDSGSSNLDRAGDYTLSAWVKPSDISSGQAIISKGDGNSANYFIKISP